ncbi:hypothetical protein [Streptomyces xanthophaeus]
MDILATGKQMHSAVTTPAAPKPATTRRRGVPAQQQAPAQPPVA